MSILYCISEILKVIANTEKMNYAVISACLETFMWMCVCV